jgi:hypothetical protein
VLPFIAGTLIFVLNLRSKYWVLNKTTKLMNLKAVLENSGNIIVGLLSVYMPA